MSYATPKYFPADTAFYPRIFTNMDEQTYSLSQNKHSLCKPIGCTCYQYLVHDITYLTVVLTD